MSDIHFPDLLVIKLTKFLKIDSLYNSLYVGAIPVFANSGGAAPYCDADCDHFVTKAKIVKYYYWKVQRGTCSRSTNLGDDHLQTTPEIVISFMIGPCLQAYRERQ